MEYITKEAVLEKLERYARDPYHDTHYIRIEAIKTIRRMEAADVAEVVRCRYCKYWHGINYECNRNGDYYCADGERKDND